jgi:hypothetical protein
MKAVAAVLLLIIASNNLFYYVWYQVSMAQVKADMQQTISLFDMGEQDRLLKVPVSELDKDESDEVWYGGNLYDVVKREMGKTNYVYLLEDKKEENILSVVRSLFHTDSGNTPHMPCMLKSLKGNHGSLNFQYMIANNSPFSWTRQLSRNAYTTEICKIHSSYSDVQTPPPKP